MGTYRVHADYGDHAEEFVTESPHLTAALTRIVAYPAPNGSVEYTVRSPLGVHIATVFRSAGGGYSAEVLAVTRYPIHLGYPVSEWEDHDYDETTGQWVTSGY